MKKKQLFRIIFSTQGKIYEIYARQVTSSEMYGFVVVEGILFGEKTTLLVDPAEEQLKLEFNGVSRFHLPFNNVIRIDEVEKEGTGKVIQLASSADATDSAPVPPLYGPGRGPGKG